MAVSIRKAFSAVFSSRYNKKNMAAFFIFSSICSIICNLPQIASGSGKVSISPSTAFFAALAFIIGIAVLPAVSMGYQAVTVNNELYHPKSVFPPLSSFGRIFAAGWKYFAGMFVLTIPFIILLVIVKGICAGLAAAMSFSNAGVAGSEAVIVLAAIVLAVISGFYLFRIVLPLTFIFMHTLKFGDLFKFRDIKRFLDRRKGHYAAFILKSILTGFLTGLIALAALISICTIGGVLAVFNVPVQMFGLTAGAFAGGLLAALQTAVYANLTAQFIKSVNRPAAQAA